MEKEIRNFGDMFLNAARIGDWKEDSLYPLKKVTEMLSICRSTLYYWEKKGCLKPVRIGKKLYYKHSDIIKLIK